MNVRLNGETRDAGDARTVEELAAKLGLAPHTVLIEHNGLALHQREWAERALAEGDQIEFVRIVAGG